MSALDHDYFMLLIEFAFKSIKITHLIYMSERLGGQVWKILRYFRRDPDYFTLTLHVIKLIKISVYEYFINHESCENELRKISCKERGIP